MKTLDEWVKLGPLPPEQAIGWLVRLSKGLLVLHELDVAHGRITGTCVSASAREPRSQATLADADEVAQDFHYYSLDRIERSGASKDDDVWALGVLLYRLVTGGYPFPGDSRRKVGERIKWMPASPISVYVADHPPIQRLLDRIFKKDEGMRLASLPLLIDALVALEPSSDALPPLELGVAVGEPPSAQAEKTAARQTPKPKPDGRPPPKPESPAPPAAEPALPAPEPEKEGIVDPPTLPSADVAEAQPEPAAIAAAVAREAAAPKAAGGTKPKKLAYPPSLAEKDEAPPRLRVKRAKKPERSLGIVWILLGVLFGVAVVVYVMGGEEPRPPAAPPSATGRTEPSAPAAPAPSPTKLASAPASSPTGVASAPTPSPTGVVSAPTSPVRDPSACVLEMFPSDAFAGDKPSFDYVCKGTDPVTIAEKIRSSVVRGKPEPGSITGTMRLWSAMGWFRMAFASAARHRCCEEPAPFETQLGHPPCGFDKALGALGRAASRHDDASYRTALARYTTSVGCLSAAPTSEVYGLDAPAEAGQATAFRVAVTVFRAASAEK